MLKRLRFAKRLFRDLPNYTKLAYCLVRDERVPKVNKVMLGGAIAATVTPFINVPAVIPVIGELDVLALTLLSLRLFIAAAPPRIVAEHRQLLVEERSLFDDDLRSGEGMVGRFADLIHGHGQDPSARDFDVIELPNDAPPDDGKRNATG